MLNSMMMRRMATITRSKSEFLKRDITRFNGKLVRGKSSTTTSEASGNSSGVLLLQTTLAMTAAVASVSATAACVDKLASDSVPSFDPNKQRFDQTTFFGRFSHMLLACDPMLLLYSDKEVRKCKDMVENYKSLVASPPEGEANINKTLWEAQRIYSAALHPDTGKTIPHPFRMSGYVPFNGPVCAAMIASSSTPALLFWGWVNQSQNALVNYFNRNASSPMTNQTLIKSYALAVGSALTVVFGLTTFINKRFDPVKARQLVRFVAFPSCVLASSLNCYIVRSPEIETGIPLTDQNGNDILSGETSKIAAKAGVYSTTLSRAILQVPAFFLPPLILTQFPLFKKMIAKNPSTAIPISTFLLILSCGIGLPATIAIFPQIREISINDVEEKYQNLKDAEGNPVSKFYYNKGL